MNWTNWRGRHQYYSALKWFLVIIYYYDVQGGMISCYCLSLWHTGWYEGCSMDRFLPDVSHVRWNANIADLRGYQTGWHRCGVGCGISKWQNQISNVSFFSIIKAFAWKGTVWCIQQLYLFSTIMLKKVITDRCSRIEWFRAPLIHKK